MSDKPNERINGDLEGRVVSDEAGREAATARLAALGIVLPGGVK
jgi:hypothetical protein